MFSKKFIVKYREVGEMFSKCKVVYAYTAEEAVRIFNQVMGDLCIAVSVEEV